MRQIVGGTGIDRSAIAPTYCYALSYRSELSSRLDGHFDSPNTPYTLAVQLGRGVRADSRHSDSGGGVLGSWLRRWLASGGRGNRELKPWPLYLTHDGKTVLLGADGTTSNGNTHSSSNDRGDLGPDKSIVEVDLNDGDAALFNGAQWFHYRTRLDATRGHGDYATVLVFHFA